MEESLLYWSKSYTFATGQEVENKLFNLPVVGNNENNEKSSNFISEGMNLQNQNRKGNYWQAVNNSCSSDLMFCFPSCLYLKEKSRRNLRVCGCTLKEWRKKKRGQVSRKLSSHYPWKFSKQLKSPVKCCLFASTSSLYMRKVWCTVSDLSIRICCLFLCIFCGTSLKRLSGYL